MFVSHRSWSQVMCAWTRGVSFGNRRNVKVTDHVQNTVVVARFVFKWIFKEHGRRAWIGLIWLRMGKSSELL